VIRLEKKEILSEFLKKGYNLDSDSLDFFMKHHEKIENFLKISRDLEKDGIRKKPAITTLEYVKTTLNKEDGEKHLATSAEQERGIEVKIIKKFFIKPKKDRFSVEDVLASHLSLYEDTKKLISSKLSNDIVSINKIQKQDAFSLIVIIREKTDEKTAVVEDPAGEVKVYFEDAKEFDSLLESDIVGLVCKNDQNGVVATRVVWPDIPLKRSVETSQEDVYCVFISGLNKKSDHFDKKVYDEFLKRLEEKRYKILFVFILGGSESELGSGIAPKEPDLLKEHGLDVKDVIQATKPLLADVGGVKILLCPGEYTREYESVWGAAENIALNILKRRNLAPGVGVSEERFLQEHMFLDETPDIFVIESLGEPMAANYKGVIIASTGSFAGKPVFWAVNLKTREINKLDLS